MVTRTSYILTRLWGSRPTCRVLFL